MFRYPRTTLSQAGSGGYLGQAGFFPENYGYCPSLPQAWILKPITEPNNKYNFLRMLIKSMNSDNSKRGVLSICLCQRYLAEKCAIDWLIPIPKCLASFISAGKFAQITIRRSKRSSFSGQYFVPRCLNVPLLNQMQTDNHNTSHLNLLSLKPAEMQLLVVIFFWIWNVVYFKSVINQHTFVATNDLKRPYLRKLIVKRWKT